MNILCRIHWKWYVLMIGALIMAICHGIQFHKWWLCGEWIVGACIMLYTEHKFPTRKNNL